MFQLSLLTKLGIGAVVLAALAGAYAVHRNDLIDMGYDKRVAEEREADNERLRESLREVARLTDEVKGAQDAYNASQIAFNALRDRLVGVVAEQRLRDQAADRDRRLATANAESLREYGATIDGHLGRCRADLARFGLEAVQCAATVEALTRNLEAIK